MLQPPHFNVAGRDLAHERSCETAPQTRLRMLRLPGAAGNYATELQQCGACDATQRLRPAARCGIRITVLISIHSLVAFATAHRKNTIQITCRYMAALLESCTESGAQDRGNYHGKCCFVIRSAKITAQDSALHSTSSPLPPQGTSTMPPPYFGARANFSHISIENTTLAIQQI